MWPSAAPVLFRALRETSQHFGHSGGVGCRCLLSPCCFAPLARKAQYFGRGGWLADSDDLERYGCKREIVVGVVLFHKLIETECHIDWNVKDLALFAKVFVAQHNGLGNFVLAHTHQTVEGCMCSNFLARFDFDWDNMPEGTFDYKVDFTDLTRLVVPRICSEGNEFLCDHVLIEAAEVGGFMSR